MSACPALNPTTGQACGLEEGHPPPHVPKAPAPAKPERSARLRELDKAIEAGRRGRKNDVPAGTYPIRPPLVHRCIYDCDAPARPYPCEPRCEEHSPATVRARRTTEETP